MRIRDSTSVCHLVLVGASGPARHGGENRFKSYRAETDPHLRGTGSAGAGDRRRRLSHCYLETHNTPICRPLVPWHAWRAACLGVRHPRAEVVSHFWFSAMAALATNMAAAVLASRAGVFERARGASLPDHESLSWVRIMGLQPRLADWLVRLDSDLMGTDLSMRATGDIAAKRV